MALNDAAVNNGETLASALTDWFRSEKWFKNVRACGLGNARSGVRYPDFDVITVATRADSNRAFVPARLPGSIGYGVSGVHDQIQNGLIELAEKTGNWRKGCIEVKIQIGQVFSLVSSDGNGGLDGMV